MKKTLASLLLIITLLSFSLQAEAVLQPSESEKIAMQTKIFETQNSSKIYDSTVELLEKNGFEITAQSTELGYICAKKTFMAKKNDAERLGAYSVIFFKYIGSTIVTYGLAAPLLLNQIPRIKKELEKKTVTIEANVNLISIKTQTKVKITMIEKIYDNKDISRAKISPIKIVEINNPRIYNQIFETLASQLK